MSFCQKFLHGFNMEFSLFVKKTLCCNCQKNKTQTNEWLYNPDHFGSIFYKYPWTLQLFCCILYFQMCKGVFKFTSSIGYFELSWGKLTTENKKKTRTQVSSQHLLWLLAKTFIHCNCQYFPYTEVCHKPYY